MEGFTLYAMILRGWLVLSVLLVMSIMSFSIVVDRWLLLRRARTDVRGFVAKLLDLRDRRGRMDTLAYCEQMPEPFARVVADLLREPGGREALERTLARSIRQVTYKLEARLSVLGTVAGTAPFVGLFGTVLGIIRAFNDIAGNSGGGPEVVSAGIAEALITTAFGLVVAIPAVAFYNHFVSSIRRLEEDWQLAASYVIDALVAEKGER